MSVNVVSSRAVVIGVTSTFGITTDSSVIEETCVVMNDGSATGMF